MVARLDRAVNRERRVDTASTLDNLENLFYFDTNSAGNDTIVRAAATDNGATPDPADAERSMLMSEGVQDRPDSAHTARPYLIVRGAEALITFMIDVFGAEERLRVLRPDDTIAHAEVAIGDALVELGESAGEWQPMPAALHVFVPDADATYRRALAAGATSLYEPADHDYGERSAGVRDASGNQWFIATPIAQPAP